MNDTDIIALYMARDERAISETAATYGRYCMGISLGIVGNTSDAEECVNDTYLRVWQTVPPKNPPSLKIYLGRIIRNLSITRYRERHRKKRNPDLEISFEELEECIPMRESESNELLPLLERFLRSEEALDRRLFVGRYWHNYSPRTLADAYGLSSNAVNLRLMRARERLRTFLEKEGYHV